MRVRRQRGKSPGSHDNADLGPGVAVGVERPTFQREEVHKRGAGGRYKSAGIDFDEGLDVVDLRDPSAQAALPGHVVNLEGATTTVAPTPALPVEPPKEPDPPVENVMAEAKKNLGVNEFLAHEGKVPNVLTWEAVRKGTIPGPGGELVSGLPASLEQDVPPAYRYWKCETREEALRVREALVEAQLFRPETIRKVDGVIRRAVAEAVVKLYLPPPYDDGEPPEVPPVVRPVEKAAALLEPTDTEVQTTLFDPEVVEAVGLDAILKRVDAIRGDWVICAKDTAENRAEFTTPTFRLLANEDLIFATNAPLQDQDSVEWIGDSRPSEILKFALQDDREIKLIKAAGDERIVFGVVLEPDEVDSQGDTISKAEIRQACHKFMEDFGNLGLQHAEIVNGKLKLLENFIAPVDFDVEGEKVKAGSWLMKERVVDDGLWKAVKKGELTGFSIGGSAIRKPV